MRRVGITGLVLVAIVAALWLLRDGGGRGEGGPAAHRGSDAASPDVGRAQEDPSLEGRMPGPATAPTSPAGGGAAEDDPAARTLALSVGTLRAGTGEKMPGVSVRVIDASGRRHEATSDAEGECLLEGLPRGAWRVEATKPGFVARSIEIHAETRSGAGAEPRRRRVFLLPSTSVHGRVLRASDGEPVQGARVIAAGHLSAGLDVRAGVGDVWDVVETDREGRFALARVPKAEELGLTVLAPGFARLLREVEVQEGGPSSREILLRVHRGATLRGVVVDRRGGPVPRAAVYVYPDDDDMLSMDPRGGWSDGMRVILGLAARADTEGRFAVHGLAVEARYAATAFVPTDRRAVDVEGLAVSAAGVVSDARLVVPDPARLDVVVQDEHGMTVEGARVAVVPRGSSVWPDEVARPVDANGQRVFTGLGPGRLVVHAMATGFLTLQETVELEEGQDRRVELTLQAEALVSGVVVDGDGRPVPVGQVHAHSLGGDVYASARLDEEGRFCLTGLPPGPVELSLGGRDLRLAEPVRLEAPADDVRIVSQGPTRVRARLVLPSGTPAPERIVIGLHEDSGSGSSRSKAWNDGRLLIPVEAGPRILSVAGAGFAKAELRIDVPEGTTLDLGEIALSPGITARGAVVDDEGSPISGARVTVVGQEERVAQTDAGGRFAIAHVRSDRLALSVEAEGYVDRWVAVERDDASQDQRVVLVHGALLRLRVFDAEGLPVRLVGVSVVPTDVEKEGNEAAYYARAAWNETDEHGRLQLRLAPGAYRIAAALRGRDALSAEVSLEEGETRELELRP